MIDLKQLIQVAPFPPDLKAQLLQKADTFSAEKKFEAETTCWSLISQDYQNRLQYKLQKASLEMAQGQKTYTREDFQKIEDDLFTELTNKLEAAGNQDKIAEIREQLASQSTSTTNAPI